MTRETAEAVDRVKSGLKKASEWKASGKRSNLRVEWTATGPLNGAYGKYKPNPTGDGLIFELDPIVGIGKSREGPFVWYDLEDVPEKARLLEFGFQKGMHVYLSFWGVTLEQGLEVLASKGYDIDDLIEQELPEKPGPVHVVSHIGTEQFRTVCKIALNYIAATKGAGYALLPEFSELRRYVLEGNEPTERFVRLAPPIDVERLPEGKKMLGHFVAVRCLDRRVVCQLSLFGRFQYFIRMTHVPFALIPDWESAHIFDLEKRVVHVGPPPPLPTELY